MRKSTQRLDLPTTSPNSAHPCRERRTRPTLIFWILHWDARASLAPAGPRPPSLERPTALLEHGELCDHAALLFQGLFENLLRPFSKKVYAMCINPSKPFYHSRQPPGGNGEPPGEEEWAPGRAVSDESPARGASDEILLKRAPATGRGCFSQHGTLTGLSRAPARPSVKRAKRGRSPAPPTVS